MHRSISSSVPWRATLPGDAGYPPLWLVIVYYNADWPAVHNLDSALKAKVLAEDGGSQLPDRFYRALER